MSINVHTFAGRIGRDAETRFTQGGKAVTGFPVAVDVGFGENKKTLWVDCTIWGERGEKIAQYITKGGVITVTGEPDLQTYQSNGSEKTKLACRVNDVQLPSLSKDAQPKRQEPARKPPPSSAGFNDGFDDSDPIPF